MSRRKRGRPARAVTATACSANRKTGPVAITYVSQGSCPLTCPFLGEGCYAELGPISAITHRLNEAGVGMTPVELACQEADLIDRLPAFNDLRLHGVGDCRTSEAAVLVAAAATAYTRRAKYAVAVWTYTHAWRLVPRAAWGEVSVLASVESFEEAEVAMRKGYAAAIVVPEWGDGERAWHAEGEDGEVTVVPCLYQSRGIQCVDCRLCLDAGKLLSERRVIAFRAHGARRTTVVKTLELLGG